MATTVLTSHTPTGQILQSGDSVILAQGQVLSAPITDGSNAGTDGIVVNLLGDMFGRVYLNNINYSITFTVNVGGSYFMVDDSYHYDFWFDGKSNSELLNHGSFSSGRLDIFDGYNNRIVNTGVMSQLELDGEDRFIHVLNSDNFSLTNTGSLTSLDTLLVSDNGSSGGAFFNSGDMISGDKLFDLEGSASIHNSGYMAADGDLIASGSTLEFQNDGIIQTDQDVVDSSSGSIAFRNSGQISSNAYWISATSSVYAQNSGEINVEAGLFTSSSFIVLENAGTITSRNGPIASGPGLYVYNTGDLVSNSAYGLVFDNNGTLINDGSLIAFSDAVRVDGNGVQVTNNGLIYGDSGFFMGGDNHRIVNNGEILGRIDPAIFVYNSTNLSIINSGVIEANDNLGAIRILNAEASAIIKNSGIISNTDDTSVVFTNAFGSDAYGHTLVNSGDILGDVVLSEGADIYNGRSGFVSGSINAGTGDDIITGGEAADVIDGGSGANEIRSLGGDDVITTGDGADFIVAGAGDDEIISGHGDDTVRGGDGEDDINGQGGVDFIQGGNGNDYIRMGNGDGQRGEGNDGDDYIAGGNQKDVLLGGGDEDELYGQGGNDVLRGQAGDDVLEGGTGDDRIIGNRGEDTAVFSGDSSDYTFTLNGNGTVDVEDTVGTDGTDNLFGVELVEFTDGTYLLSDFV